ncbi:lysosomal alpha-mannosidase isoform X2 [Pieris rapae]|uniref:lysosomal alpha-mannosidase isoform X2 n=1 Tax=Pieris rapae TaxID=64459 RepID=UPI001E27A7D8|nr:lysosomal alpha-mannosidase isoform X2 [Pieris rapae]
MIITVLFLVSAVSGIPVELPKTVDKCGYESCTQAEPGVLNVHIVPHTHDDVGWLKTVDQYYFGSRNNIQKAGVQYILDSVVKELWEDPKRRFIYVETAFFWKWWVRQGDDVRHKVHTMVRQGRLQFVGGAWSMNDEAASHYQSTIDQFTRGLKKLNETFGVCGIPRVGWQIDPFGHSREFASLLAGMGYDGLFLGRIDYQDKRTRLNNKEMEMIWRGDDNLGASSDIFTGVLYNTYSPPPGFCFDVLCDDEPIIDDPHSPMYNVDERLNDFIKYVTEQSKRYRTNNVIVTMGGDFTYQDATMWYKNLDKLIKYGNMKAAKDGLNIKLFYSTPDCYLKAVKDANATFPIKQDDFFPYASDSTAYWTGYFTSRPTTKYFERLGNNYLQVLKQLQVLANLEEHNEFVLDELRSAMGVMQHHDAVTGTEKEHVAHDYERILDSAIRDASLIANQAFNKILNPNESLPAFSYKRCRFNESSCPVSENSEQFIVTMYNPLGWDVKQPIRVPVTEGTYSVFAPNGDEITSQLIKIPDPVKNIPTRISKATHEIVFMAYLHPLGIKSFFIRKNKKDKRETKRTKDFYLNINDYFKNLKDNIDIVIKSEENLKNYNDMAYNHQSDNDFASYNTNDGKYDEKIIKNPQELDTIDWNVLKDKDSSKEYFDEIEKLRVGVERVLEKSGYPFSNEEELRMLSDEPRIVERENESYIENEHFKLRLDSSGQITHLILPDRTLNMRIQFYFWTGCIGNNTKPSERSSGAYIFRPETTQPKPMSFKTTAKHQGPVVQELWIEGDKNVAATVRIYHEKQFFEVDYVIGPIDIIDNTGKEYIVRYESDLVNNGIFYTDSNGRQTLKRRLNERPQWNLTLEEPIAGNYYPVTNEIFIEDKDTRMTILTDRSEGGTSLEEGQIELMLHRRLLHDDAFGVGEALNETANGVGLVVRGKQRVLFRNAGENYNTTKEILAMHLEPIVLVADAKDLTYDEWMTLKRLTGLKAELPTGLHLLTLEPWSTSKLLIRFENYLEKSDTSTVEIDLSNLFKNLNIKSFEETTLAANQRVDKEKWSWNKERVFVESFNDNYGNFDEIKLAKENEMVSDNGFVIKLKAKQIRTFIVDYEYLDE